MDVWPLHQFNSGDQSVIGTKTKNGKIVILAATYMGHDSKEGPPPNILKALQKYCETKNFSLIVGSDCNSHHEIWGSSDTNNRGENLLDFIFNSNLHILNKGNTHTSADARRQEVLDITLASNDFLTKLKIGMFPLKLTILIITTYFLTLILIVMNLLRHLGTLKKLGGLDTERI